MGRISGPLTAAVGFLRVRAGAAAAVLGPDIAGAERIRDGGGTAGRAASHPKIVG
jgi:hypothetical protein